ncbi:type II toxin-antitoxin system antitoxin HipB [unidentified bacterial endosymbiont]|uniref:type II toxin-antitoxin system antitoxin HipB n=1 Tax=unidentified bacterial endosymbiont TaxID=2355 RepID=UPI00209EDB64|nr:type II toxin-antitoxin system antitoxin HipB [unidentified bacterial endosymbiont]
MKPPMIFSPIQLANYMKLMRQKNNWTQSALAKKIGIKQATVSNFENNPDKTTLTTFFKILQSLEMTLALHERGDARAQSSDDNQQDLDW